MLKIKRNDDVMVTVGRDKGKRGKVVKVLENGRLIVSGVNIVKKHTKPNPQAGVTGGIVEKEAAIESSNVAIFNPRLKKPIELDLGFWKTGKRFVFLSPTTN